MKLTVIDFLRESAKFLAMDRPDIYTESTALAHLTTVVDAMRDNDITLGCVFFSSYVMTRQVEDDVEEFNLTKKLSSLTLYGAEEETRVYAYTEGIDLPHILDDGQDM